MQLIDIVPNEEAIKDNIARVIPIIVSELLDVSSGRPSGIVNVAKKQEVTIW